MKSGDDEASNLFSRLFRYVPREGETQKREPLEDFCTESLAWCLQHSKPFRKIFLGLLKLQGTRGEPSISTQQPFRRDEDDEVEEEQLPRQGSRFDLVLECSEPPSWVIVLECKIGDDRGLCDQLKKYQEALRNGSRFGHFEKKYLVTLTNETERPDGSDRHLTWSRIQKELSDVAQAKPSKGCREQPIVSAPLLCGQFASFLKERGMGFMNIRKYKRDEFKRWMVGIAFRAELEEILLAVRGHPKLRPVLKTKVELLTDDGGRFLGIQNRGRFQYLCVGFGLEDKSQRPKFEMFVQGEPHPGSPMRRGKVPGTPKPYDWERGRYQGFALPIENSGMNGCADKMKEWLVKYALLFVSDVSKGGTD
jgi:hypothetical protein